MLADKLAATEGRMEQRKERPILFSGPMVRAILDGRKTQTRRVVNPHPPPHHWEYLPGHRLSKKLVETSKGLAVRFQHCLTGFNDDVVMWVNSPYGQPGDSLWVRETFREERGNSYSYRATDGETLGNWKPSIFMPRRASRIDLLIKNVRVERLQEISEDDARAEGTEISKCDDDCSCHLEPLDCECDYKTYRRSFCLLWNSINGQPHKKLGDISWAANPFVWVIEFERK